MGMTQVVVDHAPAAPPLVSAKRSMDRRHREAHARQSKRARIVNKATIAAPAVGAAVGAALALRGARGLGLGIVSASIGFALVRWQLARFFTEGVPYEVEPAW